MTTRLQYGIFGARKWILGLAVAGIAMSVTAAVWAQTPSADNQDAPPAMGPHRPPMERALGPGGPGGPHGDHGRWWNDTQAVEKYKLTDSQRKSMDDIYQQHRVTLVDMHAALEKEELAMEPMMRADQPDEGKILSQIDRVAQARAELEKANARMLLGIRRQLTPEQWKQLEADRSARHAGRGMGNGDARRWPRPGADGPGSGGPGAGGPGAGGPGGGQEMNEPPPPPKQ